MAAPSVSPPPAAVTLTPLPAFVGRPLLSDSLAYPYRKWVMFDRAANQWNYRPLTLKAGCVLTFKWSVPPNQASGKFQNRGVAMSQISCKSEIRCDVSHLRNNVMARIAL